MGAGESEHNLSYTVSGCVQWVGDEGDGWTLEWIQNDMIKCMFDLEKSVMCGTYLVAFKYLTAQCASLTSTSRDLIKSRAHALLRRSTPERPNLSSTSLQSTTTTDTDDPNFILFVSFYLCDLRCSDGVKPLYRHQNIWYMRVCVCDPRTICDLVVPFQLFCHSKLYFKMRRRWMHVWVSRNAIR